MVRRNKKGDGTVHRAKPDFGCAGVKVQGALFVDFGGRIGRRKNLNTNLGRDGEELGIFGNLWAIGAEPGYVDSLDAIRGGQWTLRQGSTMGQQLIQEMDNVTLTTRVAESWRRAHEDVAMAIGLNTMWESGQCRISQYLGPEREIDLGLRNALRELNGDRHVGRIRQKKEK